MGVQKNLNAVAAVKYVIEQELKEYISNLSIEITSIEDSEGDIFVDASVGDGDHVLTYMTFKIENGSSHTSFDPDEDMFKILVSLYEDNYEEMATYDHSIKYFWIAFLDFPKPWKKK